MRPIPRGRRARLRRRAASTAPAGIGGERVPAYRDGAGRGSRLARPRPSRPSSSSWTTGAGKTCPSICARASGCQRESPRSRSSSGRCRTRLSRHAAVAIGRPNRLVIRIQPEEGILLRFQAKQPGPGSAPEPGGHAVLLPRGVQGRATGCLRDAAPGCDSAAIATLFMRADQVEAAWSLIARCSTSGISVPPTDFPNYRPAPGAPKLPLP